MKTIFNLNKLYFLYVFKAVIIIAISTCFFCKSGFSQQKQIKQEYIVVTLQYCMLSSDCIKLVLDINTENREQRRVFEKDSTGKTIEFFSEGAAFNYLAKKGWEYVQQLQIKTNITDNNTYRFLFTRKTDFN